MKDAPMLNEHYEERLQKIAAAIGEKLGTEFIPEYQEGIQRFPAPGKPASNTACWAWISEDFTYAKFGSHITGERYTWRYEDFEKLSANQLAEVNAQYAEKNKAYREARLEGEKTAAKTANSIISEAVPANKNHLYLTTKGVKPHDLLQKGAELVIPLYESTGTVTSLQFVYPNGKKRFLKGGRIKGSYALIGEPFTTDVLYICEGWATGATIHEKTSHPVVAAMNAGNLLEVCTTFCSKAPSCVDIIVVGDNDHATKGNPGLAKAIEAAKSIRAGYIFPPLPCSYKNCCCSDFNDFYTCSRGKQEVSNG